MKHLFFYVFAIFFLATANVAMAQTADDVTVRVSPNIPEPGERVTISLESFSVNLTDSTIRWLIKGQIVKEGEGAASISFIAPTNDTVLAVHILTPERTEITKSLNISASSVDMLWEAPDTYTPPFYKGKAMPGPESLVKFVAIPSATSQFGQTGTNQVNFLWERNTNPVNQGGGKGKDSYTILLDSLKNEELVSVATNLGGKISSSEQVFKPFSLGLSIYPLSSGGEPFLTRSLRSGDTINRESSFFAAPYGARPRYLDSKNITFSWSIGDNNISPSSRPFLVTLSPAGASNQELGVGYEIVRSLFDGFKRTYQIKI